MQVESSIHLVETEGENRQRNLCSIGLAQAVDLKTFNGDICYLGGWILRFVG